MDKNIKYKVYTSLLEKCDDTFVGIAKLRWKTTEEKIIRTVEWMKKNNFGELHETEWFEIVVYNEEKDVVGYCFFMQNPRDKNYWYLGDLIINTMYRKQGIATNIIKFGINKLSESQGKYIHAYIEKYNNASICILKK